MTEPKSPDNPSSLVMKTFRITLDQRAWVKKESRTMLNPNESQVIRDAIERHRKAKARKKSRRRTPKEG